MKNKDLFRLISREVTDAGAAKTRIITSKICQTSSLFVDEPTRPLSILSYAKYHKSEP